MKVKSLSCVRLGEKKNYLHWTWTGDSFHIWYYTYFNAILSNHPTPHLGIEPASPALAGRFFSAEPPGKKPLVVHSLLFVFFCFLISASITWNFKKKGYMRKRLQIHKFWQHYTFLVIYLWDKIHIVLCPWFLAQSSSNPCNFLSDKSTSGLPWWLSW